MSFNKSYFSKSKLQLTPHRDLQSLLGQLQGLDPAPASASIPEIPFFSLIWSAVYYQLVLDIICEEDSTKAKFKAWDFMACE
jgi:hypothetical protein